MLNKNPKILVNEVREGKFIRAWKERREIIVQVWLKELPEGVPDGDWVMPGVLGLEVAISQAVLQTKK